MVQLRGFLASSEHGKGAAFKYLHVFRRKAFLLILSVDGVMATHQYMYLLTPRCLVGVSNRLVDGLTFFDWLISASCGETVKGECTYMHQPTNQNRDAQVEVPRGRAVRRQVQGELSDASRGTSGENLGYGCREFSTNNETDFSNFLRY